MKPSKGWPSADSQDDGHEVDVVYTTLVQLNVDFGNNLQHVPPHTLRWTPPKYAARSAAKDAGVLHGWKIIGRVEDARVTNLKFSDRWRMTKEWKQLEAAIKEGVHIKVRFRAPGTTKWWCGDKWCVSAPRPGGRSKPHPDDLEHWAQLESAGEMDPWPGDDAWYAIMLQSRHDCETQRIIKLAQNLGKRFIVMNDGPAYESKLDAPPAWKVRAPPSPNGRFANGKECMQVSFKQEQDAAFAALKTCMEAYLQREAEEIEEMKEKREVKKEDTEKVMEIDQNGGGLQEEEDTAEDHGKEKKQKKENKEKKEKKEKADKKGKKKDKKDKKMKKKAKQLKKVAKEIAKLKKKRKPD
eukprot:gnl/MRDRNA2_/MRDRNA2_77326_c0_seq2.p1 gnl/MRDRNA2_/MRDRNA2_77326_c0~~gnl/MRDRNA2_/MRDRNA2_77326_c0_seq2.p1  ORF type:complete len:383 (-),score=126.77 gnl/MRDRNA2_/MRDRNA2_77326_c0_seq2:8-1069(-)